MISKLLPATLRSGRQGDRETGRQGDRETGRQGTARRFVTLGAAGFALTLVLMGSSFAAARTQSGGSHCPEPIQGAIDPETFQHRWAGLVRSCFTLDGVKVWTGEDGGRIRHRDANGDWSFQTLRKKVRGRVNRLHFLSTDTTKGWAVTADGWVLRTQDSGASWILLERILRPFGLGGPEVLYDVWFDEGGDHGIVLGHDGLWYTEDGGICWTRATMFYEAGPHGHHYDIHHFEDDSTRFWGLAAQVEGGNFLGLAVGQPGYILRSTDWGRTWVTTFKAYQQFPLMVTSGCLYDAMLEGVTPQLWDVELGLGSSFPALVVGGAGNGCGLILASHDDGLEWEREYHECDPPDGQDPPEYCSSFPFVPPGPQDPPASNHLTQFNILYSLATDPSYDLAIAVGYGGQIVLREEDSQTGDVVWRDRSEHGDYELLPDIAKPAYLSGVTVGGSPPIAYATGVAGTIRMSEDLGQTWTDVVQGEPFRIHDVWFKFDPLESIYLGWQVGQFFRLSSSDDGGLTWTEGAPQRENTDGLFLNSIAFADDGLHGVTVGTHIPGDPTIPNDPDKWPKILRTADFGVSGWSGPEPTGADPPEPDIEFINQAEKDLHRSSDLRRVCWAHDEDNLHFWAVGTKGLILRTIDGGASWTQVLLPGGNPHGFELYGVAASGPDDVVVVGSEGVEPDPQTAWAWRWDGSILRAIPIDSSAPGNIELLTDVAVLGSRVVAVGQRELAGGTRTGVVLELDDTLPTPTLMLFDGPLHPNELQSCGIFQASEHNRVLNRVALTSAGDLWIAGQCGVVWQHVAATSTWRDHKTQTDADFRGMMFLSPTLGWLAAHGGPGTNSIVVRYEE